MKSICRSWACLMVLSASGCAIYPEDAAHPMSEGWRVAHIDHTVSPDESTPLVRFAEDCRAVPLAAGQAEPAGWVLLHFRRPPEEIYRVVPLPAGMHVSENREVYVKVTDCAQALENR
jgi:hypothetical protein